MAKKSANKDTKKSSTPAAGGSSATEKKLPQFAKGGRGKTVGARLNQNWKAIEARFSEKPKIGRPKIWKADAVATHLREYVDMMPFPDVPMLPDFLVRYGIPERTYYDIMQKDETGELLQSHTYLRNACQSRLIHGALYEIFPHGAVRNALQSLGMAGSTEAQDLGKEMAQGMVGYFDEMKKWREEERKARQKAGGKKQ